MVRRVVLGAVVLAVAACAPRTEQTSDPPPSPAAQATAEVTPPPANLAGAFPGCTWDAVSGGGVAINAFNCPDSIHEGDAALPGIVRVDKLADGQVLRVAVVQVFAKAPDAPIESVLPAVRAASPGGEACVLSETQKGEGDRAATFQLMPTGKAKDAYDAYIAGKGAEVISPCGPLGPSEAGQRTFEVLAGAPDKVVMVSWPSDLPSFDHDSLRPAS